MTGVVVDASAFVQLLVDEEGSARMLDLLQSDVPLAAPDYVLVETANVLWKKVRWRGLPADMAADRLAQVESFDLQLAPTADLLAPALALACELPHPLYDVLYLLLALHGGRSLATADAKMREAAEALGIKVEWVGAEG